MSYSILAQWSRNATYLTLCNGYAPGIENLSALYSSTTASMIEHLARSLQIISSRTPHNKTLRVSSSRSDPDPGIGHCNRRDNDYRAGLLFPLAERRRTGAVLVVAGHISD